MEVLNVGGKEYVKASVIARELGYTADYVGQLCRARKVNAKLVGRSWYVDRSSMDMHKTSRYRGTQTKSKEALREEVKLQVTEPAKTKSNFYSHTPATIPKVSYHEDDAELIPAVGAIQKKTGKLSVGLADAAAVNIVSKSPKYIFNTPQRPTIKFKGSLSISEVSDKENERPEAVEVPTASSDENVSKVALNIVKSSKSKDEKKSEVKEEAGPAEEKVNPVTSVTFAQEVGDAQVAVAHLDVDESVESSPVSKTMILLSTLTAVCVALVLVGLEANIWFTSQTLTTSYLFGIDHLTASSHDAFENFHSAFYLLKFSTNFFIF
jgi:hypothetical protein